MSNVKPSDLELFALYHLGLDGQGAYRFRNLAECARHLHASPGQVQQWLQQAGIDADAVKAVPFNLTKCHVDAQFVALDQASAFVQTTWAAFQQARKGRSQAGDFHHDVNYDDIWGDGHQGDL